MLMQRAALAREAANDGHDLVLVSRRREPMEALAAELKSTGVKITVIPADLGKPGAAAALMKIVEEHGLVIDMGPVWILRYRFGKLILSNDWSGGMEWHLTGAESARCTPEPVVPSN
jgi:NAD(P)-dependent dehydrogenase (short-subunit alcohol dehydrogenase family)